MDEIKKDEFKIDMKLDYIKKRKDTLLEQSEHLKQLKKLFSQFNLDYIVVLGDRIELLTTAYAALIKQVPIIHLHGGEETAGAVDNQIRHAITKMANLHFVACDKYAKNILNMGEERWRVFNVGAFGIDNIRTEKLINKKELFSELGLDSEKKTAICTFHPPTLDFGISLKKHVLNVLRAIEENDLQTVITMPGHEPGTEETVKVIKEFIKNRNNFKFVKSLGNVRYLSLLKNCDIVVGNSSSGIIEVPFFKKPTINIGKRQEGRAFADSIIQIGYSKEDISKSIKKALYGKNFKIKLKKTKSLFGNGFAAKKTVNVLKSLKKTKEELLFKKSNFKR